MRFSTLTLSALASTLTSARIIGFAAPSTLAPGTAFNLTLITQDFQVPVADIAVAWSYNEPRYSRENSVGSSSWLQSAYLGPSKSNTNKNVTVEARVPKDLDIHVGEKMTLTAGVYSLYDTSASVQAAGFNVTVTIGTKTGGALVASARRWW